MFIYKRNRDLLAQSAVKTAAMDPAATAIGPRVLIVEDEWLVAAATEAVLSEADCVVVDTAGRADDAVRLAQRWRPDIVLMDVDLRGPRDGVEAAIEIRDRLGIRPLFMTGRGDEATRRRAAPAQPLGWLIKPCVGSQLVAAVRAAYSSLHASATATA